MASDKETIIGPETRISGDVRGEEDLVVRGRIDGKIHLTETLTIDSGGIVQADVDVKTLVVSGVLVGSVNASESVRLTDKARVVGEIRTPRFVMDAGAAYRGRVDMGEGEAARAVASRRQSADRGTEVASVRQVPRMASPPRATSVRAPAPPAAPARVASATTPRFAPAMPRLDGTSNASAPGWAAKKKLKRR